MLLVAYFVPEQSLDYLYRVYVDKCSNGSLHFVAYHKSNGEMIRCRNLECLKMICSRLYGLRLESITA